MKFKHIVSIMSLLLFLFLAWFMIFYPSQYSRKQSLNGEVLIVWEKGKVRSRWIVEVKELKSTRTVNFHFINNVVTIFKGDSLRKAKGSDQFYVKRSDSLSWRVVEETGFIE